MNVIKVDLKLAYDHIIQASECFCTVIYVFKIETFIILNLKCNLVYLQTIFFKVLLEI